MAVLCCAALVAACSSGAAVSADGVGGGGLRDGATLSGDSLGILLRAPSSLSQGERGLEVILENGSSSPIEWGPCGYDWHDSSGQLFWEFDDQDEIGCPLVKYAPLAPGGSGKVEVGVPRSVVPGVYRVVFSVGHEGRTVEVMSNPIRVGGD